MSDFNFYFTRASTIPAIVDHVLNNYGNVPLGIHFKKSVERELPPYAEHIWKLSNLTALSFDFSRYIDGREVESIWNLTRLTNLIERPVSIGKFLRLREVDLDEFTNEELTRMPNIEEVFYNPYRLQRTEEPYKFIPNPHRVTKLFVATKVDFNQLTIFTNLRTLEYGHIDTRYNAQNHLALSKLTSVRDLTVGQNCAQYYSCHTMSHVTALRIKTAAPEISQLSAMCHLKSLTFEWAEYAFELDLAPMTALHTLDCRPYMTPYDLFGATVLPPLTALRMSVTQAVRIAHLTRLHSLRTLDLSENNDVRNCHVDYSALSQLTNLVSLKIALGTTRLSLNVSSLTTLTELKIGYRHLKLCADWSLSKLTNLEVLALGAVHPALFDDLSHLTKLTYLEMAFTKPIQLDQNSSVLNPLVNLKCLIMLAKMNDFLFWQSVTKLSTLEALQLCQVDSNDKIGALTALTKLTRLEVLESKRLSGVYLNHLTSLQVLVFASRHARACGMKKKGLREFVARMPHLYQCRFY